MPAVDALPGHCLCGGVRFHVRPKRMAMDVCHCGQCRRWTGGAWMSVECAPDSLVIEGEASLSLYESSNHAERGFCTTCGTILFWRMRNGSLLTISAQAFDRPEDFAFASEIFIDNKPGNYAFADETEKLTEAQWLALFPEIAGS